jgi:hypothetical protein
MIKKTFASIGCLLLFAVTGSPLAGAAQTATTRHSGSTTHVEQTVDTEHNTWNWHHVDDNSDLQVTIRGQVEFANDYSDVTAIAPAGGELRITERRGGVTRKFEATAGDGGLRRVYSVNGETKPLDAEARAWLTKILNDSVRLSGYDAPRRVTRLLERGGPRAVLAEISELKSDYTKRVYLTELLKQGNLDAETARLALQQAAREISSDYEKAEILTRMAGAYLRDDRFRSVYLEGVNTIHSDYERGRAFKAVLKKDALNRDDLLFALKSVAIIKSDYEKAEVLVKISHVFPLDENLQMAYLDAARTISSDYEKGRVVKGLLDTNPASQEAWLTVVKGTTILNSDYEKAQLLIRVAEERRSDEAVRRAVADAAHGIQSEYERGRVLSAISR